MTFRPSLPLCEACFARLLSWPACSGCHPNGTGRPRHRCGSGTDHLSRRGACWPILVREVDVTNPNLRGGYAEITSEVLGKVTTRTLLAGPDHPGRGAARFLGGRAWQDGGQLMFSGNGLTITAAGTPLENAAIGDFIRVRNIESGVIVSGTVMDNGSIRVAPK
jgi:hypothetical protein